MATATIIKLAIALFGLVCIGLVYMAVNNDPERDESVRQWRRRLKEQNAARDQQNKR